MVEKIKFGRHKVALAAIFILGNAVIGLPVKTANEFTFIGLSSAFVCLLFVYLLSFLLCGLLISLEKSASSVKKIFTAMLLLFIGIFSVFCASQAFKETVDFISKVILPQTNKIFICVLFGATVIYFALKRQENILKFALVSFVLMFITIVFFFLAAADKYDLSNIFVFRPPNMNELFRQTAPYLKNPVLPAIILPFYFSFVFGENNKSAGLIGISIGTILLILCVLMSVLLFGTSLAGRLDFPFSSAVSTVTVGRLFTRLDGFSYFIYFVCALLRISVCLFVTVASLKKLNKIMKGTE